MAPWSSTHPAERSAVETRLRLSKKKGPETLEALLRWVQVMKSNPWCSIYVQPDVIFVEAVRWVAENRLPIDGLFDALEKPFASGAMGVLRKNALVYLADTSQSTSLCQRAYSTMEPHTPWNRDFLQFRLRCYEATQNSRLGLAQADWSQFMKTEPLDLKAVISTEPRGASGLSDSVQ